jgi:RNA polymerase sigma factor (sigma-70 family)
MSQNASHETRFRAWLEAYRGIFFKITRSFARTPTDASELQQEMLLQLWNSLPAYSGYAADSTWIYRVCLNTAIAWRRGTTRREARIEPGADLGLIAGTTASPADSAGQRELLEKLYAAIRRLGDFDRALVLLMLDELNYREIAEITGISENHVGVALGRARKRLAIQMKGVIDELE